MAFLGAWAEHVWTRMRRLDYWNTEHAIANTPAKLYRRVSPGSQPAALVQVPRCRARRARRPLTGPSPRADDRAHAAARLRKLTPLTCTRSARRPAPCTLFGTTTRT